MAKHKTNSSEHLGKVKECYLCSGTEFKQRTGAARDNPELKIYECTSCGLVYLSSFEHIHTKFYNNSGMHGTEEADVTHWIHETEWDDSRRFQYLKALLPNRSLLDFGCGTGGFLMKARELAAVAEGVEPETRLIDHFLQCGLTVFDNLPEVQEKRQGIYDIVTLFHVLEHLPDPKSILLDLNNVLADDGQIIVEVPNADDALITLYGSELFSHFIYWSCHLYLFTAKTIQTLITQCGFQVNYCKQIQRYSLANHLYWLSKGQPDGHRFWHFLDSPELQAAYEKKLGEIGKCDTLILSISKKKNN